jgi:hypothetical protein
LSRTNRTREHHSPDEADERAAASAHLVHARLERLSPRWRVLTRRFGKGA